MPAARRPTRNQDKRLQASGTGKEPGMILVPDTSVIVDGRITILVESGEYRTPSVLVHEAVVGELEAQANRGMDSGFNGLDELTNLQRLSREEKIQLEYRGDRPDPARIAQAGIGAIDDLIRRLAQEAQGRLVTSDKVQALVCESRGIDYHYIRPITEDPELEGLEIHRFFDDQTMSVHLKQDCAPYAKRGTPEKRTYEPISRDVLKKGDLNRIARQIVEAARRDDKSFVEIERQGSTVVQLRNMRIAIARPPFSDAIEITAVRPVTRLRLEDYKLPAEVVQRLSDYHRGVFVSGPPGSGKSTFAQAVAEYLHEQGTVVKTMESPRDLQLPDEITQYAPLEQEMELTGDILLLVRPDFVVYDEVRKGHDFAVFADMRLAGVGLVGVTHANRAIDAIQRLIGRVELGMIPQVVDTVVHIVEGKIQQILEMDFTVRVPSGMTEADLARPVIRVRDFQSKKELYEIYTYGDQVVVMPIEHAAGERTGQQRLAEEGLLNLLRRHVRGDVEVEMTSDGSASIYVEDWEIASIIGKGGSNIQRLEETVGLSLDVKELKEKKKAKRGRRWTELVPIVQRSKKSLVLVLEPEFADQEAEVYVDGDHVLTGHVSKRGEIRVKMQSAQGRDILDAQREGRPIVVRL